MLGIILCGGQSLRMGSDKGLLKLEAKTWTQTAIDKMAALDIPVKISVNSNQYLQYAAVFPTEMLIADNKTLPLGGPLLGVLSSHIVYPTEDIFVLACDMPLMNPVLLKQLYSQYLVDLSPDAFLFTNDGEPEPLCGIYRSKALSTILSMLKNEQLPKHSMKFMLGHLTVDKLVLEEDQKKYFRNFNAHAELNGL
jgi:molybdopterin-guanine dinucleotide biosynthesis protein A